MAKEYIEREAALQILNERPYFETADLVTACGAIAIVPTADVAPIAKINDAVDEALRILDAINSSGCITYNTYCKLHNAICEIYQDSL